MLKPWRHQHVTVRTMLRDARLGLYARVLYSYFPELEELTDKLAAYLQDVPMPDPLPALKDGMLSFTLVCTIDALGRAADASDKFADKEDKTGMGYEVRTAYLTGLARPLWELAAFKVASADNQHVWDPLAESFPAFVARLPGNSKKTRSADMLMRLDESWDWILASPSALRQRVLRQIYTPEEFAQMMKMADMRRVLYAE